MKPLTFISILLIFLSSCQKETLSSIHQQVSSDAKVSLKGQESLPLEFLAFNECTDEWVVVSLVIEYKFNYFVNKDDFHAKAVYQVKDGYGVGQTSGDIYKLVGQTLDVEKQMNYETTENQTFRIKSKLTFINPNGKDWVNESIRVRRILEDGTIVVDVEEENSYCR